MNDPFAWHLVAPVQISMVYTKQQVKPCKHCFINSETSNKAYSCQVTMHMQYTSQTDPDLNKTYKVTFASPVGHLSDRILG